jgi:serine/threonine protein kinase
MYYGGDPLLQHDVALKVLSDVLSDPDDEKPFVAEAQAFASINQPNIVRVHDVGEAAHKAVEGQRNRPKRISPVHPG